MLTRDHVIWAYRCFFGRDPEDEKAIEGHRRAANWDALRRAFISSSEFKRNLDRMTLAPVAAKAAIEIVMTEREKVLLDGLLKCTRNYLEFGAGGSTVRAAEHVSGAVVSVDSSRQWLQAVRDAIPAAANSRTTLFHIDIGPVGDWGYPAPGADSAAFGRYSRDVWKSVKAADFDLFLIDGRFRVASFAETVRHASPRAQILVHDYVGRPHYHVMETIARKVAVVDQLALFNPVDALPADIDNVSNTYRSLPD